MINRLYLKLAVCFFTFDTWRLQKARSNGNLPSGSSKTGNFHERKAEPVLATHQRQSPWWRCRAELRTHRFCRAGDQQVVRPPTCSRTRRAPVRGQRPPSSQRWLKSHESGMRTLSAGGTSLPRPAIVASARRQTRRLSLHKARISAGVSAPASRLG